MLIASATYACHLIESLCGLCSGCVFWSDMWLCVISLLAPWAVWGIVFNPCCPPLPCRCIRQCSISVNLENMLTNSPAALSVRISEAEAINCWSVPYRYIFQGLWSFPSVLVTLVPLSLSLSGCASVNLTPLLFIKEAHNQLGNEGKKSDEPAIGQTFQAIISCHSNIHS